MSTRSPEALTYLRQRGAHFVLCWDKRPLSGFPWRDYTPDLDCVLAHRGNVGLIPFSVGTSALDVDKGEPTQLSMFHQPLVIVPSQRPGGEHFYYRDDTPRGNQQWSAFGCGGEVRSAKGYLILYRDAPVLLAHALANDKADCSFPAGLLEYAEPVDVGRLDGVMLDDLDRADSPQLRLLTPGAPVLERVQKGRRNLALFDAVRFWSYGAARGYALYDDWLRAVEIRTLAENRRFPEPLTERHALSTGYSVAVWTWTTYRSGYGPGWTMEQRSRGGLTYGRQRRYDNRERDMRIIHLWEAGQSERQISATVGLSKTAVHHVLKRNGERCDLWV